MKILFFARVFADIAGRLAPRSRFATPSSPRALLGVALFKLACACGAGGMAPYRTYMSTDGEVVADDGSFHGALERAAPYDAHGAVIVCAGLGLGLRSAVSGVSARGLAGVRGRREGAAFLAAEEYESESGSGSEGDMDEYDSGESGSGSGSEGDDGDESMSDSQGSTSDSEDAGMGASEDEEGSSMASSESEGSEERTELVLRAVSTGHSGSDGEGDDQEDSESGDQEEEEEDDMDAVEAEMDAAEEEMGLAYDDEEGSDSEAEDEAREDAEEEAELDAIERRYLEEAEADADYEDDFMEEAEEDLEDEDAFLDGTAVDTEFDEESETLRETVDFSGSGGSGVGAMEALQPAPPGSQVMVAVPATELTRPWISPAGQAPEQAQVTSPQYTSSAPALIWQEVAEQSTGTDVVFSTKPMSQLPVPMAPPASGAGACPASGAGASALGARTCPAWAPVWHVT
ncbi:hypothetical protein APUTEX25_000252 [Auxenochlorella protothecoides]|uniref:Uncharacterized protein n=1 Tax=Auxenochlorella protothecoides TaxID=3075 RepID=A0A3M7L0G3_AUXPR|nr:hypothetical protein APUTEX25_000252 [Auxenochlorella protothecoides]|eukprot:RMZ55669.1 hypothetical protein APUTEX25_000252 [Auxenochlorella protothecoides]